MAHKETNYDSSFLYPLCTFRLMPNGSLKCIARISTSKLWTDYLLSLEGSNMSQERAFIRPVIYFAINFLLHKACPALTSRLKKGINEPKEWPKHPPSHNLISAENRISPREYLGTSGKKHQSR